MTHMPNQICLDHAIAKKFELYKLVPGCTVCSSLCLSGFLDGKRSQGYVYDLRQNCCAQTAQVQLACRNLRVDCKFTPWELNTTHTHTQKAVNCIEVKRDVGKLAYLIARSLENSTQNCYKLQQPQPPLQQNST